MPTNTGRDDYDQILKLRSLNPDEPYFLLRGQDAVAAGAVRAWASLARAAGASEAVVEQALRQADRMEAWPTKKVADADHLSEEEQKQLAYAFSRRAWNARTDAADDRIILAEERGQSAAEGRLRPVLTELFENGSWQTEVFIYVPKEGGPNALFQLRNLSVVLRAREAKAA